MNETMQAVVYHGSEGAKLEQCPIPRIQQAGDALLKVKKTTICASDIHIIHGAVPRAKPGVILGHEFVGEVIEIGAGVQKYRIGDRVAVNCETFCGSCYFCKRGYINNCENGGWELGCRINGSHAEYTRVPYADNCLTKIPEGVSYEDALFVGDIVSSGYFGAELAQIQPGDTVAVLGSGPVGMCTMMCASLFGAGRIIAIDTLKYRLDICVSNKIASDVIDASNEDVVQSILALTNGRGADAVIEAAGGTDTFQTAWQIARPNAVVAVVAMYENTQMLPLNKMYGRNLIFKTGGVDAVHCERIMGLIKNGKLNTNLLITHRSTLNDIMEGYRVFGEKLDHCLKWVISPVETQ
jgi:alcohol dehydrogenase